ncbi:MAG: GtrA family protein [Candidatus Methanomethylophilaceae archaeon]|nr:GtrA family protein [Candidatus Methanomethylophilaceae archaeon]
MHKHDEGVRYIIFGFLTVIVSWISYALLALSGVNYSVSNGLSWFCAVIFAFFVNKYFVFRSLDSRTTTLGAELIEFFASRLFTGAVAIILFPVLMNMGLDFVFLGVPGLMARGVNTTVEIILNYILSKFVVFRRSNNTKSKP